MPNLLLLFLLFVGLCFMFSTPIMILWEYILLGGISIYFIIKKKNIEEKDILTSCILGMFSMSYNFTMGLVSILAYLASASIFKESTNKIEVLKSSKKQIIVSITLALFIGIILGTISILSENTTFNISFALIQFFNGIRVSVAEEVIFRMLFFALCVNIIKDKKISKSENIMCYLIMIVPHVLMKFTLNTVDLGMIGALALLSGLLFALLQRKRDLTSAIVCHSLVYFLRVIFIKI